MENNNWRAAAPGGGGAVAAAASEVSMDTVDWRAQLQPDSRQRIVNKIMETLKRHLPFSGQEGLQELKKIAVRFEEKIYTAATSQSDYLRKISLKMLTMENKSQNTIPNPSNGTKPPDPGASLDSAAQTGNANGGDWQEDAFQKLKQMKDTYFPELNDMYQKIAAKLQQHDSLPQQPKSDQLEKLKMFKQMLERIMSILQMSKSNIPPGFKEKLGSYERQIINFINTNRPRKPIPPMQQGQISQPHLQSMQQTQSQIPLVQSHDTQMNPQMQTMNMQGPVPGMQQNNMSSLQHNSVSSMSSAPTSQQNMIHQLQSGSNMDSGLGNAISSLRQVTLPQNPATSQQSNMNPLSSQSPVNLLQPNVPLQSNSSMLQQQHLKQQQEQQLMQSQQLKQHYQQRQMQQQLMQKMQQQLMQKMQQQPKQQVPGQMQTHQMQQLHQMNDVNEMKIIQGMGVKPGVFQQHLSTNQRSAYSHQQMKAGASFPISSPLLLQATSPQLPQNSSPQVDQQNLLSTIPMMLAIFAFILFVLCWFLF